MWQVYLFLANERQHADEMSARPRPAGRSRIRRWRTNRPAQPVVERSQTTSTKH